MPNLIGTGIAALSARSNLSLHGRSSIGLFIKIRCCIKFTDAASNQFQTIKSGSIFYIEPKVAII